MSTWPQTAAVLVAVLGAVAAAAAWRLTRTVRRALAVLLDFLTAAALLRLAGQPSWYAVALAAAVVALRGILGPALAGPDRGARGRADSCGRAGR
ncbi:hypothetical protein ACFYVL_02630 [Streptomyces sp. NPDC004111]|uniref:hypothetical protein n=1 Tax=Streptomyces sp. NPDC004111 TaxID=3364690 RepID=UPI003693181B